MEQTNKLYEIIKPVRILEQHKSSKFKKGFIALAIVLLVSCGIGFVAYDNGLDMNLPFEINKTLVGPQIYSLSGGPTSTPLINPGFVDPSFIIKDLRLTEEKSKPRYV